MKYIVNIVNEMSHYECMDLFYPHPRCATEHGNTVRFLSLCVEYYLLRYFFEHHTYEIPQVQLVDDADISSIFTSFNQNRK